MYQISKLKTEFRNVNLTNVEVKLTMAFNIDIIYNLNIKKKKMNKKNSEKFKLSSWEKNRRTSIKIRLHLYCNAKIFLICFIIVRLFYNRLIKYDNFDRFNIYCVSQKFQIGQLW